MNAMLRALMIDRYKIAFHYEDRPMDTATLVAVKPKDPGLRSRARRPRARP